MLFISEIFGKISLQKSDSSITYFILQNFSYILFLFYPFKFISKIACPCAINPGMFNVP